MIEVVIPAYNAGHFLRETLESVATQTLRPDLVTVVDDRSTDDTVAVANASRDALAGRLRIQVLANDGPRGPSAGRNTAIRRSCADWIALLDADDLLRPGHHEYLFRVANTAPDVVLGFGDSSIFQDMEAGERRVLVDSFFAASGVADLPAIEIASGCLTLADQTFPAMLRHGLFGTSACLFRRERGLATGLFDESMMFCEDTDFFLRLSLLGRFAFTQEVTTLKRVHDANLSQIPNKLGFCRGIALSYNKLATQNMAPPLTPWQRSQLQAALDRAIEAYLYHASLSGPAAYLRAARLAWQSGRPMMTARPRHLLRIAARSVVSPRQV
jgi:glycosyltransferase involved in cell wall biosynthesis